MPIYEYVCESCGHQFEKLMKIGAEPPPCDECGAEDVKKRISAPGFVLKGGGWYKDHYGLKGKKSGGSEGSGDAGKKLDTMKKAADSAKSGGSSGSSSGGSGSSSSKGGA